MRNGFCLWLFDAERYVGGCKAGGRIPSGYPKHTVNPDPISGAGPHKEWNSMIETDG